MTKYRGAEGPLDEPTAQEEAARRVRVGAGAFVAVVLILSVATPLPFRDAIGLGLFYVLLPALGWAQLPLLSVALIERAAVYAGSAATLVVIGSAALIFGLAARDSGESVFPPVWGLSLRAVVLWTAALAIVGLAVIMAFEPLDRWRPGRGAALVRELLPRTRWEKLEFVGLSFVAGINEEVAYRGYALSAFGLLGVGSWTAVLASAVPFAILHAYQGPVGVARTAVVGVVLAGSVVASGSLLPAILAHVVIDIIAGLVVGPWFVARAEREG
jgi:membrane protease YdiL (CAAX protease family)